MKTFIRAAASALVLVCVSSAAVAQCLIDTPKQRAIWDRMKRENTVGYQQILFNTTWDRYADAGRWEMMRGLIDRDPVYLQKAVAEFVAGTQNFTLKFRGNESREWAVEAAMMYGCLKSYMTAAQEAGWRAWMMDMSEGTLAGTRFSDSDQMSGTYLGLLMTDKVLGTHYGDRDVVNPEWMYDGCGEHRTVGGLDATAADCHTMRNRLAFFFTMAEGGRWIEAQGGYDDGTTQLVYMGITWLGWEHFPEAKPFLRAHARHLMHMATPDLKDLYINGDQEHPHEMHYQLFYAYGDIVNMVASLVEDDEPETAAALRQFEADIDAVNGYATNPLLARYYYWNNPFAAKRDWRSFIGTEHVARGQGDINWRSDATANARGTHIVCPTPSRTTQHNGGVDHQGAIAFGEIQAYGKGQWWLGRPYAYGPDQRWANTVLTGASYNPGGEATDIGDTAFLPGVLGYADCTHAGQAGYVLNGGYSFVPEFNHETHRKVFDLLDGPDPTLVVIDRIKSTPPKETPLLQDGVWYSWEKQLLGTAKYINDAVDALPPVGKMEVWQTRAKPTISATSFEWVTPEGLRVKAEVVPTQATPIVPTFELIDNTAAACATTGVQPCIGGYIGPEELAGNPFSVHVYPAVKQEFDVLVTCLRGYSGSDTTSCTEVHAASGEPIAGAVVHRAGRPTSTVIVSGKEGPRLVYATDGGEHTVFDYTDLAKITAARQFATGFSAPIEAGAVYVSDLPSTLNWVFKLDGQEIAFTRRDALMVGQIASAGVLQVSPNGAAIPPPSTGGGSTTPPPPVVTPAPVTGYQLKIYDPSAAQPTTVYEIPASAVLCGLAPSPSTATTVNPTSVEWDSGMTFIGAGVCRWNDGAAGVLFATPVGTYDATITQMTAVGPSAESTRARFSKAGVTVPAPTDPPPSPMLVPPPAVTGLRLVLR